ncbi:MAG: MFS transporter [Actinomycetota bacterium]
MEGDRLDSGRGWWVTGAAAVSTFTVFGVAYSFGAFFESMAEEFDAGSGATALVFSITISASFLLGSFTGRWADRFGPRPVLLLGAASLAVGLIATTTVPNLLLGYVTYGLGVGLAVACGYVPMVSTVGGWFDRQRPIALGVAVAGIGLGTLVGSPIAAALIEATTWRTTFVVFALVGAALLIGCSFVARPGPAAVAAAAPRKLGELLRLRDFAILYGSSLMVTFGLFVPFVFLATYAEDEGIGEVAAAALIGIIGGASIVGRLGLGALAARLGTRRLYRVCFLVMALSHPIWFVAGASHPLLIAYAITLGVGYGGFIAVSPAVAAERFGLEGLGGVLGTLYTSAAIGSLFGPPIAGVLIDEAGYGTAIGFATVTSLAGWVLLMRLGEPVGTPEPQPTIEREGGTR